MMKNIKLSRMKGILVIVGVILILFLAVYLFIFHWNETIDIGDDDAFCDEAHRILSDSIGRIFAVDPELSVLEKQKNGKHLAMLVGNNDNMGCILLFERDSLFSHRYHLSSSSAVYEGKMAQIRIVDTGEIPIHVFGGLGLPDEAVWYTFERSGVTYTCPIKQHRAFNFFVFSDYDYTSFRPAELLNGNGESIGLAIWQWSGSLPGDT